MAGGNEGHGDFLADQVLGRIDPGAFAGDQGFGGADLGGDEEGFHRQLAGRGGGQRAGTEVADLHVTGGDGGDHIGAVVEFAPVDAGLAGLFITTVDLGHLGRVDGGLVGDGQVGSLGENGGTGQRQGGKQAQWGEEGHVALLAGSGG